jgi:hypothetical protein
MYRTRMSERPDDRPPTSHEQILAELARTGFRRDVTSGRWELDPADTGRGVHVQMHDDRSGWVYSIEVYEFRGGEGSEDEELRSADAGQILDAIPRWAEWAKEPFIRPRGWWQRLRAYLGLAYGSAEASGSAKTSVSDTRRS